MRVALLVCVLALALLLGGAGRTHAFGTIRGLNQDNEHERITRVALECSRTYLLSSTPPADVPGRCFEAETADLLAGDRAALPEENLVRTGAVGATDMDAFWDSVPHCTDGDFLPSAGYPRPQARAHLYLRLCRDYLLRHFRAGLLRARALVNPATGAIVAAESSGRCRFIDGPFGLRRFNAFLARAATNPNVRSGRTLVAQLPPVESGASLITRYFVERVRNFYRSQPSLAGQPARCQILGHLGRVLHLIQDFYAHSNWTDRTDRTRPIGVHNPRGLARTTRAPLLDPMTRKTVITPGLITACFTFPVLDECRGRVDHDVDLGKDKGHIRVDYARTVPWENGFVVSNPRVPRAVQTANFFFAVRGAVAESRGVWKDFTTRLMRLYPRDGATMICLLTRDDPGRNCRVRAFRYRVRVAMTGGSSAWAHEFYARTDPRFLGNYRGGGSGSSSWNAEWTDVEIRLNRTDRRVFAFVTDSESFSGRASGQWTDKRYYNSTSDAARNGHTCRYDTGDPTGRRAGIVALPLQGDLAAAGDKSYDAKELFALIVSRGPSASASCDGFETTPVRDAPYAYDGGSSCHFAIDREYLKTAPPIRIPISLLGEDKITLEQRFDHSVAGCFPGGGFGDPEEYCVSGACWKGTKSRSGIYRVTMTLIKP